MSHWRQPYPSNTVHLPSLSNSICWILGITGIAMLIALIVWRCQ